VPPGYEQLVVGAADAEAMATRHGGRSLRSTCRRRLRSSAAETPEQLKGLIRAGYVYRGDEHFLTDKGRDALAQLGVQPGDSTLADNRTSLGPGPRPSHLQNRAAHSFMPPMRMRLMN
jgi:hypothetical protein